MNSTKKLKKTTYKHNSKIIPLYYGNKSIQNLPTYLKNLKFDKIRVILDPDVNKFWGKRLKAILKDYDYKFILSPKGEKSKDFENYKKTINSIFDSGISKNSLILAFGGGSIGNLAGFIASTIYRGIKFIHLPTTIIAQADSVIGGKQAINTIYGKNTIGSIYEPEFILIDFDFLRTLPKKEIKSGIVESIKHALCQDKIFLSNLSNKKVPINKIIEKTFRLKIKLFSLDPEEIGDSKIFIYGHEIGHVIEVLSKGELTHGESIGIGMICSAVISNGLGYLSEEDLKKHFLALKRWDLPTKIPKDIPLKKIINQMNSVENFGGSITKLVLLEKIGKPLKKNGTLRNPIKERDLIKYLGSCY